ncbi:MAG: hypothetical protein H7Y07_02340 [Pyrinomonadaceae bacterium]|nr:hypothetical protein [Sphingobacteriaceae bacterium]
MVLLQRFAFIFLLIVLTQSVGAQVKRNDTISSKSINLKSTTPDYEKHFLYSVGIKAFSIEEFPQVLNQIYSSEYTYTTMGGLFAKFNDKQVSYRLAGNFYTKNISFKNECETCEDIKGKIKDFEAKMGFEKNFSYSRVQPYFAFDLGYIRNTFTGAGSSVLSPANTFNVSTLKHGILFSPNFGIRLNIISRISIAAETGMGLLYSYEKQEKISNDINRTRTFNEYSGWEFLFKPVNMLTLQYNLGITY